MGHWKAIQTRKGGAWELYDLSRDVSEKNDIATQHPDVLEKAKRHAERAHEPALEGVFHDRVIHERDRQAKWGDTRPAVQTGKVETMPPKGLIPRTRYKILNVSSESRFNGKYATNAVDGNPRTHWHTRFEGELAKHPHELVIDLGREHTIRGVRYLARQDGGWNGAAREPMISALPWPG